MPPARDVLAGLRREFLASGVADKITFPEYLKVVGFCDPSAEMNGMDDGFLMRGGPAGPELFSIPQFRVTGNLEMIVLLVDFPDLAGTRPKVEYESLLFEKQRPQFGSLADYFNEVSAKHVDITGSVHGWLRLPKSYAQYTSGKSGMSAAFYPDNAQGMAEDAVKAALNAGVSFPAALDKLNQGIVTALFIVHAGRGAEVLPRPINANAIWSHKWVMRKPVQLSHNLLASVYLTVPEDCELGVCAHELGHLAFQWEDFYDANYKEDGDYWDGSGDWDLMASGSYNGDSRKPAYPVAVHRLQHGWIKSHALSGSSGDVKRIELPPNEAVIVRSSAYRSGQYLLLENRQNVGFDVALPGHGLLVWRVDESQINTTSTSPGLFLLEADANDSWQPGDFNQGDAGDPFPGSQGVTKLDDVGRVSTTFPGSPRSGIAIESIREVNQVVSFDVRFK